MYGINDVFDYASDLRNPRKGVVEGAVLGRVMHRTTLIAAAVTNVPFLIYLAVVGNPLSWAVLAVSVFAVLAYSAPGLRFKERHCLDSITSSTHFVSPPPSHWHWQGRYGTRSSWPCWVRSFYAA